MTSWLGRKGELGPIAADGDGSYGTEKGLLSHAMSLRQTQWGCFLTAAVLMVAVVGPLLAPYSPTEFVGRPYQGPSGDMLLGTDTLGRDVLSRFLHGGLSILAMALGATALGVGLGGLLGLVAASSRKWVDDLLMRGGDVLLAIPQVVLVLLVLSTLGPRPWLVLVLVGMSHSPRTMRVMRGAALAVVQQPFVEASRAAGERHWRVVVSEILPNTAGPYLVEFGLRLTYSIGLIAAIGFLGFGLQPPAADWGLMINENRLGTTIQPLTILAPVLAIAVLTVGANLITDGLTRAVTSRSGGR